MTTLTLNLSHNELTNNKYRVDKKTNDDKWLNDGKLDTLMRNNKTLSSWTVSLMGSFVWKFWVKWEMI